jgi:hypothetical protein
MLSPFNYLRFDSLILFGNSGRERVEKKELERDERMDVLEEANARRGL